MFKKCIRLWKRIIYSWHLAKCRTLFDLDQEVQQQKDILRAIADLDKAEIAGRKALNLLSEKYFPKSDKARTRIKDIMELIGEYRQMLVVLSQRMN